MIKRKQQVITQKFKGSAHKGVDLRCVNFITWQKQPVVAPEKILIIRNSFENGKDKYGNNWIAYKGLGSKKVLKSIHVRPINVTNGMIFEKGEIIGQCELGGNSKALHEHFEVWDEFETAPENPVPYIEWAGWKWKMKGA